MSVCMLTELWSHGSVKFTTLSLKANKVKCGWQRRGEKYEAKFWVTEWRKSVIANCGCVTLFALKNYVSLLNDLLLTEFEFPYIWLKLETGFQNLLSIINVILYNLLNFWVCFATVLTLYIITTHFVISLADVLTVYVRSTLLKLMLRKNTHLLCLKCMHCFIVSVHFVCSINC